MVYTRLDIYKETDIFIDILIVECLAHNIFVQSLILELQ